jgi:glycosyltransferase involved in cell wall biosynthesis/SAM-dependent methyltransferase
VQAAGLFDAAWYRHAYPDVAVSGVDPLWHFVSIGAAEGRNPNPLFDTHWYLTSYPDVAADGANPLLHYFAFGAAEGRDPGPSFATAWYVRTNADVRVAGTNPLGHYLTAGEAEGRRPRPLPARYQKVVYISGEPDTPGHVYRVVHHAEAIRRLGGEATVLTIAEAALARLGELDTADMVVLWRVAWCADVERITERARRAGAVLVFDVDDLMTDPDLAVADTIDGIRSQRLAEDDVADHYARIRRTAEACDACTSTTPELAARLRPLGKPAYVLPNGFDDTTFVRSRLGVRLRRQMPQDDLCRVGYASGSLTHQRDFAVAAQAVADVLRALPHVRLVLYRGALDLDEFPAFVGLQDRIEWRHLVPHALLPIELARLDVNLAPLQVGNPFCEAKSALKFFEAALVDVPTVASPTEPFRSAIDDGVDGFLAGSPEEWRSALARLVGDPQLRRAIGSAARRSALWRYGPERRSQGVKAVVDQVLDAGQGAAEAFELEVARSRRPPVTPPEPVRAEVMAEHDRLEEALVTVVVPVHNYAELVPEALDSVAAQTLGRLDLVVVDDASIDDSLAVVSTWIAAHADRFNRVVLLHLTENAGLAQARNVGFDAAETPFVLPLDADNALLPDCCERLLAALEGSTAAFAYPRIRHFGEASDLFPPDHVRGWLPYAPQRLVAGNYIDAMALMRRSAWLAVGGYHDGLGGWEDYDLWCRLAELGLSGVQVAEDLALYRVHGRSMLHTVTHQGDRLAEVHEAISAAHPWVRLERTQLDDGATPPPQWERPDPPAPATQPTLAADAAEAVPSTGLSPRARRLLPLLRCPDTGEALEESPDGRSVCSAETGRTWPIVDGRPVLYSGLDQPAVFPADHLGNPLPARAEQLIAQTTGMVLHLSGGGTRIGRDNVVEVDGALFGPTDVVGDAHHLPLADRVFDLAVVMNAFEHYREPDVVVAELRRVLRPGGLVFVHTAFLQPVHEAPHHYFNATRYGIEQWFGDFETLDLRVSDNFHPGFALAWLASDIEEALATDLSPAAGAAFRTTSMGTFADYWRDPASRQHDPRWEAFAKLTPESLDRLGAGFEYLGRVPHRPPDSVFKEPPHPPNEV